MFFSYPCSLLLVCNTLIISHILLKVPKALDCSSFHFAAASDWNELQETLKRDNIISISSFKDSIMDTLTDSYGCFVWCIVISTLFPFVLLSVPNNVCTMFCAVIMLCCYHDVLSCVAAMLCFCLRCLFCRDYLKCWIPPRVPTEVLLPFGRPSL